MLASSRLFGRRAFSASGFVLSFPRRGTVIPVRWEETARTAVAMPLEFVSAGPPDFPALTGSLCADQDTDPWVSVWVHREGTVLLTSVLEDHEPRLDLHWSEYDLHRVLGPPQDAEWGPLRRLIDDR